jgi:hypothetical protein
MRILWPSATMRVSNTEAMLTYIEGCSVENDITEPAAHYHEMLCGYCGHRISVLESKTWNGRSNLTSSESIHPEIASKDRHPK